VKTVKKRNKKCWNVDFFQIFAKFQDIAEPTGLVFLEKSQFSFIIYLIFKAFISNILFIQFIGFRINVI
jgi:hypothetical protein